MHASIRLSGTPPCPAAGRTNHHKPSRITRTRAAPAAGHAATTAADPTTAPATTVLTPQQNYANLCSNMGELARGRPASGYAGRWSRYQGPTLDKQVAAGDIVYGFRTKDGAPGTTQVWKAEEGDLNSPKLQAQRDTLPQLQTDPLQLQLDMDTLVIEVSEQIPLLDPSFTAVPTDKLPATLKTLAVPDTGNLVVAGALPTITGQAAAAAAAGAGAAGEQGAVKGGGHPEAAKTWFNRLYLRAPGSAPGGSSRWSVMVHYDTVTGNLLTHYHTWEAGIRPEPRQLQEVFAPGAHRLVMQEEHRRHTSIRHLEDSRESLANIKPLATYTSKVLTYSEDGSQCSYSSSGAPVVSEALLSGGPGATELWYDSACYFRVPSTLHPEAVGDHDVIFEFGALIPAQKGASNCKGNGASMGRAAGLVRWLLCYASTGSRRLKWAKNELFAL